MHENMDAAADLSIAPRAFRVAASRAERRGEVLLACLVKKMRLDGHRDLEIAKRLNISVREVSSRAEVTTPVYAEPAGLPLVELVAVEKAVDQVLRAWCGLDADELWDWGRIYDGEHGLSVHGHFALKDNVEHALNDVVTYSRRLDDLGLAEEDRPTVLRALRLAQARARAFGAHDTTIHARMAKAE